MSRVEQIEFEVKKLNADELKAFREWFAEFDASVWDLQLEADASDKVLSLAQQALRDHEEGRSTEL